MIHIEDIHPLSAFQRNAKKHIEYINKTGRAEVLTINGSPQAILVSKDLYSKLSDLLDQQEVLQSLKQSFADEKSGKYSSAQAVFKKLKAKK